MFQTKMNSSGLELYVFSKDQSQVALYGAPSVAKNVIYDDSVPCVDPSDVCVIEVNGFKVEFFSADYSSLLFAARNARVSETGELKSVASSIFLSKEDAAALAEALERRVDLAKAEKDFYAKNGDAAHAYFVQAFSILTPKGVIGQA